MLTIERRSVFNKCPDDIKKAMLYYCDAINKSNADLYVVMAHKATCLIQLLIEEGLIHKDIQDKFVSNTALDFDCSDDWKEKKVIIIDDILISGSGVALTVNQLIDLGARESNINIIILVRNTDFGGISFLRKDGSNMLLCEYEANDEECLRVSYEISAIFARLGICYDVDFPTYKEKIINAQEQKQLLSSLLGDVFNISNKNHKAGNIDVITLFPNDFFLHKLWMLTGINLKDYFDIKFRLFFHNFPQYLCSVNIAPLALLKETNEKEIDHVIEVLKLTRKDCQIAIGELKYSSKVRLIQFYIAHCLACTLYDLMNWGKPVIIQERIRVLFGSSYSMLMSACLNEIKEKNYTCIDKQIIKPDLLGYQPKFDFTKLKNDKENWGYYINETLYNSIKYWEIESELPAREHLKKENPEYFKINEGILRNKVYRKLRNGLSFAALMEIIKSAGEYYNIKYLISLFIDRGIDEGIVVPIIQHQNGVICRVYRHGEDLPFGEADKIRLLFFLKTFSEYLELNSVRSSKIGEISFEKIIVLFYQVGIRRGIFNRFLGFDNDPLLQEGFCKHGAIRGVSNIAKEHVYIEMEYDESLNENMETLTYVSKLCQGENAVDYFVSKEEITNEDGSKRVSYTIKTEIINAYLNKPKENNNGAYDAIPLINSLDRKLILEIEGIAKTIGAWYCMDYKNRCLTSFKNDITCFTSCFDIFNFSSCMATALRYFKRYWTNEVVKSLNSLIHGESGISFSSMRFSQTLPSARDKHAWYSIEYINFVKNRVRNKLEEDPLLRVELRYWDEICNSTLLSQRGNRDLRYWADKAVEFVYRYSVIYDWLNSNRLVIKSYKNEYCIKDNLFYNIDNLYNVQKDEELLLIKKPLSKIIEATKKDLQAIEQKPWGKERINELVERVNAYVRDSDEIISRIENSILKDSHEYTIDYNSCIIVTIGGRCTNNAKQLFRTLWNRIPETLQKTNLNIIFFREIGNYRSQYGIFYKYQSEIIETKYLLEICEMIHIEACKYALQTEIVFIPDLDLWTFKHNLRRNISINVNEFLEHYDPIIEKIRTNAYTEDKYVHSFSIVSTKNIEADFITEIQQLVQGYKYYPVRQEFALNDCGDRCLTYVLGKQIDKEKQAYSTVAICRNSDVIGTGFLFNYYEEVFCISCMHLFDKAHTPLIGKLDNGIELPLKILNKNSGNTKYADKDILILSADLSNNPDLDICKFFSIDDCVKSSLLSNDVEYVLRGYKLKNTARYVTNIKYIGDGGNGFIQMECKEKKIDYGDSGGTYVSKIDKKLVGMHSERGKGDDKDVLFMIPMESILEALKTDIEKEREGTQ